MEVYEYEQIPRILKRFSFDEKVKICQYYSGRLINIDGLNISSDFTKPFPWELETFFLFSVAFKEWKNDRFSDKKKVFSHIINTIRNYNHPFLKEVIQKGNPSTAFADNSIIALSAIQFDIQEFYQYKLYRYNYYFSFCNDKIDMPQLFQNKFGLTYSDFLVFGQFLWVLFSRYDFDFSKNLTDFITEQFKPVILQLSLTREEYIEELNSITTDISDYLYCLRPSYSYPFIIESGNLYLPLPHLLIRSITSSLLYRLTDSNNKLSELIGKEVLESYLYHIIHASNIFDEVFPEQTYYIGKKEQRTLDVMARKGDHFIFFDSKMYTPKRDLRIFQGNTFDDEVSRLAKACKQIYQHIHDRFSTSYNPFSDHVKIDRNNIYGFVIVRDDPHIPLRHIYHKTAEFLKINDNSPEFNWLCMHIGIVAIYEIEKYCFTHSDLLNAVLSRRDCKCIDEPWLTSHIDRNIIVDRDVRLFKKSLGKKCMNLVNACEALGIFNKEG